MVKAKTKVTKEKEVKESPKKSRKKFALTSFTIIILITIILGVITHFLPQAQFVGEDTLVDGSGVVAATLSDVVLAPVKGFIDAADVSIFILVLGGLLAVVAKTGTLEMGVKVLVKKLKGRELVLIPILMFIFSIAGTTYGFLEESVPFYALLAFTMVAAGMDTIVASAVVLLGAGSGVLGSTINPFATGAAIAASGAAGVAVNKGPIMILGVVLWLASLIISIIFVMRYAKKVIEDKGSTFLSLQEQEDMKKHYAKEIKREQVKLTGAQRATIVLFALVFIVMITGFIPWPDLEGKVAVFFAKFFASPVKVTLANLSTSPLSWWRVIVLPVSAIFQVAIALTGTALGSWWFEEAAVWFLIMAIIIGIVNGFSEKDFVKTFLEGTSDILSVILIIAVARGITVLMKATALDNYILINAANALKDTSALIFAPLAYLLHVGLSFLIPSSSGLAGVSTPIMAPLTKMIGYSPEVTVMIIVAANGLVNLITPTCGAIMGGLALAKVEYSTWVKWSLKVVVTIGLVTMAILTLAMLLF